MRTCWRSRKKTIRTDSPIPATASSGPPELLQADGTPGPESQAPWDRAAASAPPFLNRLLADAQKRRTIRTGIGLEEVIALLSATRQGILRAGWSPGLRRRTLAIIFAASTP